MVRIRHGWLVAALALGISAAACKKDEKKDTPAAGGSAAAGDTKAPTTAEKPATPAGTPTTPAAPAAGAAAADLKLLPKDSEAVMGLNFAQLQKSALWKKFVEPQMVKPDVQKKLEEFKAKCGFDPMTAMQTMSLGLKNLGPGGKPEGVVVLHGPDKGKVMACLDKMKPEAEKEGGKITTDQDVTTVTTKDGDSFAFTFTNDSTLVGVFGAGANTAGVKAATAGNSTLSDSAAFKEMYGKINTNDSLWLLMNGKSKAFEAAGQFGVKPQFLFGSVNVTDGLTVDMRVRLETADQAAQIANMAKGQIAQFQKMVDKLDVTNENTDVRLNLALSTQKLEALVQQFAGLIGGGMGMGGGPGGGM